MHPPSLDECLARVKELLEENARLRVELEDTKARLAERKLIERAKGILMRQRAVSEEEAFAALRTLAMHKAIRLGEAAQQVIEVSALLDSRAPAP